MTLALFLMSIPICIADLKEHKIPNIYLSVMLVLLSPLLITNGLGDLTQLCVYLVALVVLHLFGMGMGDVKLLSIIGAALNSSGIYGYFSLASCILLYAALYLISLRLIKRSTPDQMPLAPSIFMGLFLYLATR
jgi:Flp pilus assembly protein protease CpaA